jgi:diphthamide synthase (EF-2-diphthine--ammonia ligase)
MTFLIGGNIHQVFTSWSLGKDSCLACYRATLDKLKVHSLLNMVTNDGRQSWTHEQSVELLQAQSQATGIPIIQHRTTMANYETEFKNALLSLKKEGITGGIFGDIDLEEHRLWIDRMCGEANIIPY